MRVIAIDWSGARDGADRKIWLGEAVDGTLIRLEDGRGREAIAAHLIAEAERDPAFVVGLDFAFSLLEWFLAERGLADGPALWEVADREAERWLASCESPFWGRPGRGRPNLPAHFRLTDRAAPPTAGIQPKSPFQIGGAGAVGTGSLRGMRLLHRLHAAGFAVWPFDPPAFPLVVEIYPRLLTSQVVKSSAEARAAYLDKQMPQLAPELRDRAAGSEDAFDAAVSAAIMAAHLEDLGELPALADPSLIREGVIWSPAWRAWYPDGSMPRLVASAERPPSASRRDAKMTDGTSGNRQTAETMEAIERFNAAFNRHDVDAVMALMTDDCVFENTSPAPDGERYEGQAAVRAFWERFFASSPRAVFEVEDLFAAGDRCLVRWRYRWGGDGPGAGHVRGVDVFRVRDGKVAEKLSYVKG